MIKNANLLSLILDFLLFVKMKIRRALIRSFNLLLLCFPIKTNKIVFDNYMNKDYGCNPKYIAQKLIERGGGKYDLVWIITREHLMHNEIPEQFRIVPYGSLASYWEYATAKFWVSNYHKISYVKRGLLKRKDQIFIQTWHGSLGIKRIENDVPVLTGLKGWLPAAVRSSRMVDYWISNSTFETDIYKRAFYEVKNENILVYGHPRNDIFFDPAAMQSAYQKVALRYHLEGRRLLLYAPTFRDDFNDKYDCKANVCNIDYAGVLKHIQQRFGGDWAILVRQHPRHRDKEIEFIPSNNDIVDVTHFADMQELLAAADCLITDYSSCAFDFMLTRRPVFLFALDRDEYEKERGFYYPLESTPFPLAYDNEKLLKNIDLFDECVYSSKIESFLTEKGCMEDGRASERVADLIEKLLVLGKIDSIEENETDSAAE